ncbi:MAG: DUF4214 domain-containing protein [Desulfobulbaceae bacterium]|nr:DUF4214 domain-containing protein [Desulfobulbaceae bacterium]
MKIINKRIVMMIISFMFFCFSVVSVFAQGEDDVYDFVTRFYEECLDRSPDQAGLDDWVNALISGSQTGEDVAEGFINSKEFTAKNLSNGEYLVVLYRTFFDREPDSGGYNDWLNTLATGALNRTEVLSGFTSSSEFDLLCQGYDITAGSSLENSVSNFVTRFYQQCLNRDPDAAGLDGWVEALTNGDLGGDDVAEAFVFSDEFTSLDISDSEFITILYHAFFNREPDPAGYNGWLNGMAGGLSRSDVLDGFISAREFLDLCEEYGITCHSAQEPTFCNSNNLDLCTTSSACTNNAGGYWYNNTCNSNLTMSMLAGTYKLKAFTVVYDAGLTLTQDDFTNFSGTMSVTPDGAGIQTINILGESVTLSGDFGLVDNETLKVFVDGNVFNMEISFSDNVLTTSLKSGAIPGLAYSETDVWEKVSSVSSNTYFLSSSSEIEISDESPDTLIFDSIELYKSKEELGGCVVGGAVGILLD